MPAQPRTPRPPKTLEQKLGELNHDHQGLRQDTDRKFGVVDEKLTVTSGRLGAHDKTLKLLGKKQDRMAKLIETLGERLAATHDTVMADHGTRLSALEQAFQAGTTGGNKAFMVSLRESGVSDEQLAQALMIIREEGQELDLSNDQLFTELTTTVIALRTTVENHGEQLRQNGTALAGVTMRTNALEDAVGETRTEFAGFREETNTRFENVSSNKFPTWGLPVAAVIGVIAAFLFNGITWRDTVPVQVGNQLGAGTVKYHVLDSGWTAVFFGVLVAFMVLFVASLFSKSSSGSTQQTTTMRGRVASFRERRSNRNTGANQPQGNPAPQPAPTQPLPAQPARVPAA